MLDWIWIQAGVSRRRGCGWFDGYLQTPRRFPNKRKLMRYSRLGITRRGETNGKRLGHPRLDNAGVGSLKGVSRCGESLNSIHRQFVW
ncbi:hypothetical protein BH20ACI2_BH20ACI2_04030 [soil metagenome]